MSVLRINQNPIALNANRNLKVTGMAICPFPGTPVFRPAHQPRGG